MYIMIVCFIRRDKIDTTTKRNFNHIKSDRKIRGSRGENEYLFTFIYLFFGGFLSVSILFVLVCVLVCMCFSCIYC